MHRGVQRLIDDAGGQHGVGEAQEAQLAERGEEEDRNAAHPRDMRSDEACAASLGQVKSSQEEDPWPLELR